VQDDFLAVPLLRISPIVIRRSVPVDQSLSCRSEWNGWLELVNEKPGKTR
jgi:hypothetical protein